MKESSIQFISSCVVVAISVFVIFVVLYVNDYVFNYDERVFCESHGMRYENYGCTNESAYCIITPTVGKYNLTKHAFDTVYELKYCSNATK